MRVCAIRAQAPAFVDLIVSLKTNEKLLNFLTTREQQECLNQSARLLARGFTQQVSCLPSIVAWYLSNGPLHTPPPHLAPLVLVLAPTRTATLQPHDLTQTSILSIPIFGVF